MISFLTHYLILQYRSGDASNGTMKRRIDERKALPVDIKKLKRSSKMAYE
jgi:hypothetical protein